MPDLMMLTIYIIADDAYDIHYSEGEHFASLRKAYKIDEQIASMKFLEERAKREQELAEKNSKPD